MITPWGWPKSSMKKDAIKFNDDIYLLYFAIIINIAMLKRRRRIQKYIKALKNKARGISAQDVEKLKI